MTSSKLTELREKYRPWSGIHGIELQAAKDIVNLLDEIGELQLEIDCLVAQRCMTIARLGGIVEGMPTSEINFLQRIDELRRKESAREDR